MTEFTEWASLRGKKCRVHMSCKSYVSAFWITRPSFPFCLLLISMEDLLYARIEERLAPDMQLPKRLMRTLRLGACRDLHMP